mmetsp:Transcript_22403/g.50437  ORF Transcript_22403/g.50437 Transcript_22403/m.50437 type:complete len:234 (+) Transcript_22403:28-729(+)
MAEPSAGSKSKEPVPVDRQCGHCRRRISLVESTIKCRCGLAFCERHRAAESHGCTFDWQQMQRDKVARENPKVVSAASKVRSSRDWRQQYCKHHPVHSAGERSTQRLHLLGFAIVVALTLRGVLGCIARPILLPQQMVLGYVLGLLCVHVLPGFLGLSGGSCRFCIFSWDLLANPAFCLEAEWEQTKEHALFALTAGKRNCLTQRLYDGPRTVPAIAQTVLSRLKEGQFKSCG